MVLKKPVKPTSIVLDDGTDLGIDETNWKSGEPKSRTMSEQTTTMIVPCRIVTDSSLANAPQISKPTLKLSKITLASRQSQAC